jgi:hypothetical protein
MNDLPTFSNTINNIECSQSLSYLLNFWHTTKVIKEQGFIKRNGIHPKLVNTEQNENNSVSINNSNSTIQTNFYTVFRIFLENVFNKEIKIVKSRSREEWDIQFKQETNGLDSFHYLFMNYSLRNNLRSHIIQYRSPYGKVRYYNFLSIKIKDKDQLYSKAILDNLKDLSDTISLNIDESIVEKFNYSFVNKIFDFLNIKNDVKAKEEVVQAQVGGSLDRFIPIFKELNSMISGMESRTKFSFISNYVRRDNDILIENNESNYQEFLRLTENMAG